MKLSKLLSTTNILQTNIDLNIEIDKVVSDSRKAEKNSLFVAIKGENRDGNYYIKEAIGNGAVAFITDDIDVKKELPYILVENSREALSKIYSQFYNDPSRDMKIIAITGTNGKTSTCYYLYNVLRKSNKKCGLISTIECLINDEKTDINGGSEVSDLYSAMTTPDPEILYYLLNKMKQKGVEYVILETSSHAIKQRKLAGISSIDIGVFTNLTYEHMNYHKYIEDYFETKNSLFKMCKAGISNIDDEYGKKVFLNNKNVFSLSSNSDAEFKINDTSIFKGNCLYTLSYNGKSIRLQIDKNAKFAIYNSSMAASVALLLNINEESIKEGLKATKINGRLEKYKDNIYIDYAHTPIATDEALKAIKSIEENKEMIVVFGCGGNRDKSKRAEIGKIVSNFADIAIITSDNPRNEDRIGIIKDIMMGIDRKKPHLIIPDRKEAIICGVKMAKNERVLVLLGKGHEEYEIDSTGKHYFSEKNVIDEALLL